MSRSDRSYGTQRQNPPRTFAERAIMSVAELVGKFSTLEVSGVSPVANDIAAKVSSEGVPSMEKNNLMADLKVRAASCTTLATAQFESRSQCAHSLVAVLRSDLAFASAAHAQEAGSIHSVLLGQPPNAPAPPATMPHALHMRTR